MSPQGSIHYKTLLSLLVYQLGSNLSSPAVVCIYRCYNSCCTGDCTYEALHCLAVSAVYFGTGVVLVIPVYPPTIFLAQIKISRGWSPEKCSSGWTPLVRRRHTEEVVGIKLGLDLYRHALSA